MFKKFTTGFVVQTFNDEGKCIEQEFIAGDGVEYMNVQDRPIVAPENEQYQPLNMEQPS